MKLTTQQKALLVSLAERGDLTAKALVDGSDDRIATGCMVGAPTTASSQATGAGATDWNVNLDKGLVVVNGVVGELAAAVDFNVHTGSNLLASGQSAKAAIVVKKDGSTFSFVAAVGAAATTGSEVAPTDAQIQTAVGAGLPWLKVAECTLNRTGDLTVTQSQDNTKRDVGLIFA